MTRQSKRLSITPIGRAVAQSCLHPSTAIELLRYSVGSADTLVDLVQNESTESILHYVLFHAAYSSKEYSAVGGRRNLPYQINSLVHNPPADQSEGYLIERPWRRNPAAANAALIAVRWAEGLPRSNLAREFSSIGSGILQSMFRDAAEILFAWTDVLVCGTGAHLADVDRHDSLPTGKEDLRKLRSLASAVRVCGQSLAVGLPGESMWLTGLRNKQTGRELLSRLAVIALQRQELVDPITLLRHDTYRTIVEALRPVKIPDLDTTVKELRTAIREYREDQRNSVWNSAIRIAPPNLKSLLEGTINSRGTHFESMVEEMLVAVGIPFERLDDGQNPGAADLHVGLNGTVEVVIELKTSEGSGTVGLNGATEVISGAHLVGLGELPKATVANPGFDPNVPWQARKASDLSLVEACNFSYGISLVARSEIDKDRFLAWLAQPGMLSSSSLYGSQPYREF